MGLLRQKIRRAYQDGVKLDVGVLLQELELELGPTLLADPRRPLLGQDVVTADLA